MAHAKIEALIFNQYIRSSDWVHESWTNARGDTCRGSFWRGMSALSLWTKAEAGMRRCHSRRTRSVCDADELELFVAAWYHPLGDLPDAARVVLLLGLWLGGAELAGDEHALERSERHSRVPVEPQHVRLVQRLAARAVLPSVPVARARTGA